MAHMNPLKGPHFKGRKADKMVGTTFQIITSFISATLPPKLWAKDLFQYSKC